MRCPNRMQHIKSCKPTTKLTEVAWTIKDAVPKILNKLGPYKVVKPHGIATITVTLSNSRNNGGGQQNDRLEKTGYSDKSELGFHYY